MTESPRELSLLDALDLSLAAAPVDQRDLAAVNLARMLAGQISVDPDLTEKLAPKLTALLNALGLTPAGRKGGRPGDNPDEDATEAALADIAGLVDPSR